MKRKKNFLRTRNIVFGLIIALMALICIATIVFTILSIKYNWIKCITDNYLKSNLENAVGVSCQVISAISCGIISIIGLSFSLQDSEYFGIKINKLFAMRVDKHFSFMSCAIISIVLLAINVVCYIMNFLVACWGTTLISLILCIYVLCTEVPLMTLNNERLLQILRDRFKKPFKSNDYLYEQFNKALANLICSKDIKTVYNDFQIQEDKEHNKKLLLKLLDVQCNVIYELDTVIDKKERHNIIESFRNSAVEIISGMFDIYDILGESLLDQKYYIERIFFTLLNTEDAKEDTALVVADLISFYSYTNRLNDTQKNFYLSVVLSLIIQDVSRQKFVLLSAIRKKFSLNYFGLSRQGIPTVFFAIISLYLYYLAECEQEAPQELKNKIRNFISYGAIEDDTIIISWKQMFKIFAESFPLSYDEFIYCFHLKHTNMEFMLKSSFAHTCVLSTEFAMDWYLTILFSSHRVYNYDYEKELSSFTKGHINWYLKEFVKECFKDRQFIPTDKMLEVIKFYGINEHPFSAFKIIEENQHKFLNYIDKLKKQEFEEFAQKSSQVKGEELVAQFQPIIRSKIESDWHFEPSISVENEKPRFMHLIIERYSEAINFEDFIVSCFVDNIFHEIESKLKKDKLWSVIVKDSEFDQRIKELLNKNIEYVTQDTIYDSYAISDDTLRSTYQKTLENIPAIKSSILPRSTFILKDGFQFNCLMTEFKAYDLTLEQLNLEVDKYKRADGQYVYEGTFLSREEVARYIKDKFIILEIGIKYKIATYPGAIWNLDLFSNNEEDI